MLPQRIVKINNVSAIGFDEGGECRSKNYTVHGLTEAGAVEFEIGEAPAREMAARLVTMLPSLSPDAALPCEQVPSGRYLLPLAVQAGGAMMPGIEGPTRIRLVLEGGYELEIPATQEAIDALYRTLRSLTTRP